MASQKIQARFPKIRDLRREIIFSTLAIIIFSFPPLLMLFSDRIRPHATFYEHIG
jgi:hypothetical protein